MREQVLYTVFHVSAEKEQNIDRFKFEFHKLALNYLDSMNGNNVCDFCFYHIYDEFRVREAP